MEAHQRKRELRNFGLLVGGIFLAIAGFLLYRGSRGAWPIGLGSAGAALVVFGLIAPIVLYPIHKVWMGIAFVLAFVNTRILLGILYYVIFTPIAFVQWLRGKDPLRRSFRDGDPSYWIPRTEQEFDAERYFRQF